MTGSNSSTKVTIFVLRFWQETRQNGGHWLGRIEHVQSKDGTSFQTLQGIRDFIQRYGIILDEKDISEKTNITGCIH